MKTCSTIDTDDMLYKLLRRAVDEKKIGINGVVCQGTDRPADSQTEDIVINTIVLTHDKPQDGTSNVNIYVPDRRVKIRGQQQTKANWARLKEIGDAVVSFIEAQNLPDFEMWIESDTTLQEPTPGQHYRNIRIKWNIH